MSAHPFEEAYDTIGSLGGMICSLVEAICGLAQDSDYNLAGQQQKPLTAAQLNRNLNLDAVALAFSLVRVGIKIPYRAGRHKDAFPFEFALWAINGSALLRNGIAVGTGNLPGGNMAVGKVLGGVEIVESMARLVLQCIVTGFNMDVSDIEDNQQKSTVMAKEILALFANIFSAIGGACSGGSQWTPEPSTKGTLKVIGLGGKGLFALMTGLEVFVDKSENLLEFTRDPGKAFQRLNDALPWT